MNAWSCGESLLIFVFCDGTGTALPDGFVTEEGRTDLEAYAAETIAGTKLLPVFNTGTASNRHLLEVDEPISNASVGECLAITT